MSDKNIIIQECNLNAIQRKINEVIEMHKNTETCQTRQIKLSFTLFTFTSFTLQVTETVITNVGTTAVNEIKYTVYLKKLM